MTNVTVSGRSVQEALHSALKTLDTTEDKVQIEIIEEPKKGFLGLIGSRQAMIKVSLVDPLLTNEVNDVNSLRDTEKIDTSDRRVSFDPVEAAADYLKDIINKMGIEVEIEINKVDNRNFEIILTGDKMGILIGKRGQTLNAYQYMANIVANQHADNSLRIELDAENYRQKRKESLIHLAKRSADKVERTGKKVKLEPMPANERKVIHTALQRSKYVQTSSEGIEPHRYIVIDVKL